MKILFLTENFPPEVNAAATRVYERACYWVDWGHEVTVVTTAPNFPQGKLYSGYQNRWYHVEEVDGIRVVRVKSYIAPNRGVLKRTLDFLSFFVSGSLGGIFQNRADVVVATSPQFFSAVAGWLVGLVRRTPFIFELGDLWPASIREVGVVKASLPLRILEQVELFLYRQSAAVVALTNSFKDDLVSRGIRADKIDVVINGVDLHRYEPTVPDPQLVHQWELEEKFVVGYVGTHGMAHGLENVLNAASMMQDYPEVVFLFVGDGAERESLISRAAQLNLHNVRFEPPQPKAMMPNVWSVCDVALIHLKDQPVFRTVIPSKMFEAMSMGLPLLMVGPKGEASNIVDQECAGLSLESGNPGTLADAVKTLAGNDGLRSSLGANSLNAAPRYSRRKQAELMLSTLETAVGTT